MACLLALSFVSYGVRKVKIMTSIFSSQLMEEPLLVSVTQLLRTFSSSLVPEEMKALRKFVVIFFPRAGRLGRKRVWIRELTMTTLDCVRKVPVSSRRLGNGVVHQRS